MNEKDEKESWDDHALMDAFQDGSEEAFELLYNRYWKSLYQFALKFSGDAGIAKDSVQQTFLYLYQKREDYQPNAKLTTLLFKVVRSQCLKHLKKTNKESNGKIDWSTREGTIHDTHPREQTEKRDQVNRLEACIERLSNKHRETLVLRMFDDLKYREIAEILDIPIGTVKSRLNAALKKLRKMMNENCSQVSS